MSSTDGMISAGNPLLLTLKGQISVHLLSGDTVEGKFAAQDAYNFFLMVDDEPLMIPRVQVKFIKGREGQQIKPDSSHDAFFEAAPSTLKLPESSPPEKSRDNTEAYSITDQSDTGDVTMPLPSEIQSSSPTSDADDSDDTTDTFYRDKQPAAELDEEVDTSVLHHDSQITAAIDEIIEDSDGTVLLYPEAQETPVLEPGDDEEDGTVILFPPAVQPPSVEYGEDEFDDFDGTVVLGPSDIPGSQIASSGQDETDEDDQDMTVFFGEDMLDLPDEMAFEDDDDDMTVVMGQPEEPPQPTASLTCIGGPHAGEALLLSGGITTMGRSSDNVVVLSNDKEISRHHAIILQESGKYVVQDQNSLNGTFVNDEPVTTPRYLENGDEILVGLSILKYEEV